MRGALVAFLVAFMLGLAFASPAQATPYWGKCQDVERVAPRTYQQACYKVYPHHKNDSHWMWMAWRTKNHAVVRVWPWRNTPYFWPV